MEPKKSIKTYELIMCVPIRISLHAVSEKAAKDKAINQVSTDFNTASTNKHVMVLSLLETNQPEPEENGKQTGS
jgi:hypothetical protein